MTFKAILRSCEHPKGRPGRDSRSGAAGNRGAGCDARRPRGVWLYDPKGDEPMKRGVLLASLAATGILTAGASAAPPRSITVNGSGIITTVPNQVAFSFGVSTTGRTAQEALGANARLMSRVIAALGRLGLHGAALQTAEISLTPNTNQAGTTVVNYGASNSVTATTGDIARAGMIIDAAVHAGANLVSGPSLTLSDQLLLDRRALTAAIADARGRAEAVATAAGVRLGAVQTVTEQSNTVPVLPGAARSAAPATTPVEAGTVQTEEDVTVTFAIA
jgi:uncharacterized protein YggE